MKRSVENIKNRYVIVLGLIFTFYSEFSLAQKAENLLAACAHDPRVMSGMMSAEVCAGADIFFRSTFKGNGRTCGTCHRAEDNFTISPEFISKLPKNDPLFIADQKEALATLERSDLLREFALTLENIDGLEDLDNKFTLRSIPHTLSMATSISPSSLDGTTVPPVERTGWSGDGAPGDGSLRDFLTGAIIQHFPKDLSRTEGVSFILPTELELDLALEYQLALGRTNEIDLTNLSLADTDAQAGIAIFQGAGRCNACHLNAGANFIADGNNRNFNTGVENIRIPEVDFANTPLDGGFGGQGLTAFNFDTDGDGINDAFGDGSFNSTPLIEAADTGPFFHTNAFETLEEAIAFYNTIEFANSPSGQLGAAINLSSTEINQLGRLLRVLNVAFNIDIALQRLNAIDELIDTFGSRNHVDTHRELMELASFEIQDALEVLRDAPTALHQTAQRDLTNALLFINISLNVNPNPNRPLPRGLLNNAISRTNAARAELGEGIDFVLGSGNLIR